MSNTIDSKVVEMRFDNQQFEDGVKTSLSTLDKLKNALHLKDAAKGLEEVNTVANRMNFSGLSNGLDTVKMKFSAMEVIGMTALANLTNSAIDAGKRMTAALTITPAKDGFAEYELKMGSIQTIMAGTGESLETVNKYLNELNKYADQTIYSFSDMTSNIGKFTNAGVSLDKAVAAIKGVSNAAAVSGANTQEASRAMYNFAQALSAGYVKLIDWKSIENANMATVEFKNQLLETALAMGTVVKVGDMYQTTTTNAQGKVSDLFDATHSFNEALANQWMTSEVLIDTLNKYADSTTEIGKKATQAATEVKTFSQLMDTLKEALGTGWADTWEILVGNFEEAKTMFTAISNTLGGMIDASSDARNNLVKLFKTLGGREAIVNAITNAFNSLMTVVKTVKVAFQSIFPPATGKQLADLAKRIEELTKKFAFNSDAAFYLYTVLKNVFGAVKAGIEIAKQVGYAFSPILKIFKVLAVNVIDFASGLAQFTAALVSSISKSSAFTETLQRIHDALENFANNLQGYIDGIINKFIEFVEAFRQKIDTSQIDGLKAKLGALVGSFDSFAGALKRIAEIIRESISKMFSTENLSSGAAFVVNIFTGLLNIIGVVASKIGKIFAPVARTLDEFFNKMTLFEVLQQILKGGGLILLISKFGKVIEDLSDKLEALHIAQNIIEGIQGIGEVLEDIQDNLKANVLLKIAAAVGILTASIVVLATVDMRSFENALITTIGLFGTLMVLLKNWDKLSKATENASMFDRVKDLVSGFGDAVKLGAVSSTLLKIAGAVGVLAASMKIISTIPADKLLGSFLVIEAFVVSMAGIATIMGKMDASMRKGAKGMIAMSTAVLILAGATKAISSIPEDQLLNGVLAVEALLVSLTAISTYFSKAEVEMTKGATAMIAMSAAVLVLAGAVNVLAKLNPTEILTGVGAVIILLGALGAFVTFVEGSTNLVSIGAGLLLASAGILVLSQAVKSLGSLSLGELAKGLIGLAASLTIITIALNAMEFALPGAAALTVASVGLLALAGTMKLLGGMALGDIGKAILALAGSLAVLAVGLTAMIVALPGAAALVVAAKGILLLIPALVALGAMKVGEIVKGLTTLAATLVVIGTLGTVLGIVSPLLMATGVAMALLGGGMLALGVGVTALATGLAMFATMGMVGVQALLMTLQTIITGLISMIPTAMTVLAEAVGTALITISQKIIEGAPVIVQAVTTLLSNLIASANQLIPNVVGLFSNLIDSIVNLFVTKAVSIAQAAFGMILTILDTIQNGIPQIIQAGVDIIVGFCQGIASASTQIVDAAFKMMIDFINGLAASIEANTPILIAALNNLAQTMVKSLVTGLSGSSALGEIVAAGMNLVKGFIQGISNSVADVAKAAIGVATAAVDAVKDTLGIHSPSTLFEWLAEMCGVGFTNEMDNQSKKAADSGTNFGDSVFGGANESVLANGNELLSTVEGIDDSILAEKADFLSQLAALDAQADGQIKSFDKKQHELWLNHKREKELNEQNLQRAREKYANSSGGKVDVSHLPISAQNDIKKANELRKEEAKVTQDTNAAITTSDDKAAKAKKGSAGSKKKTQEEELKDYNGYWAAYLKQQQEGVNAAKYKDMELQDFMKNTLNESKTIVENYMKEYESAVNGFMTKSIFEEIQKKEEVKAEDLKKNLSDHLSELREYRTTLYELHKKVEDEKFWQVIDQFGMDGLESLKALNKMAPEELQGVADTVQTYYHEAQTTALVTTENSMRQAEQQLNSLLGITNADLKQFIGSWGGTWETLNSYVQKSIDTGKSMVTGFTNAATTEMKTKAKPDLEREGALMADDLGEAYKEDMVPAGEYAVDGLVDGATSSSKLKDAYDAGKEVGDEFMRGYTDATITMSPSRMFKKFGGFAVDGLVLGVKKSVGKAYDAGKSIGDNAMDAMRTALDKASYQIDMMDTQPVIRPIMDLSDIQNGVSDANSMMRGISGFNISGTAAMANSSAMMMNRSAGSVDFTAQALYKMQEALKNMDSSNQTITNTFNITGNNPKEIADEVSRRIQMQVERRSAVWA